MSRPQLKLMLRAALAVASLWLIWSVTSFMLARRARVAEARANSEGEARKVISTVDERLGRLVPLADALSKKIADLPADALVASLKEVIDAQPELNQVGVAFAPFAFDPAQKHYAPYYVRQGGDVTLDQVQNSIDYTVDTEATLWYHRTMREGAGWSEPYYDPPTEAVLAEYVVPIVRAGKSVGVVYVNYALTTLADIVASTELGRTGYGLITSSKGALAYHPNRHLVIEGRTLADLAKSSKHKGLEQLAASMQARRAGTQTLDDPLTGRPSWVVHEPLKATSWTMAAVVARDAVIQDADVVRRFKLRTMVALALVIGLIAALGLGVVDNRDDTWRAWVLSGIAALTLTGGIAYVWIQAAGPSTLREDFPAYISQSAVSEEIAFNTKLFTKLNQPPPIPVAVGVVISKASLSGDDVHMSGQLWMRASDAAKARMGGPLIPVLEEASSFSLEPAYESKEGKDTLYGWRFKASVKNSSDFTRFPFERQQILLRFALRDEQKGVILVPDLPAYETLNPSTKPGANNLRLPGRTVSSSLFTYLHPDARVDFGDRRGGAIGHLSRLAYVVRSERSVINAFIAYGLPIIVVLLLLFVEEYIGLGPNQAMGAYRSAFFIAIIAHIGMRSNIGASELVYLEWFFILTYLALLGLSVSALGATIAGRAAEKKAAEAKAKAEAAKLEAAAAEGAPPPSEKLEKPEKPPRGDKADKPEPPRSQKLVKLLYLPSLTLALLVVTLAYFY
jgi:hypothetical protein